MESKNFYGRLAREAEEKILKRKFCFACQTSSPIETGRYVVRTKNRVWKCAKCLAKQTPAGFKKVL
jgi:ribosomal protein L37AE/L43A